MAFDAHDKAFAFYGGACARGIYDNMSTAVDAILTGEERRFNTRFERLRSHHLVEPTACSPAAGWERERVEKQVKTSRDAFFKPIIRGADLDEVDAPLAERTLEYAKQGRHPEFKDRTIWEAFEGERAALIAFQGPFRGFHETAAAVSKTCLVGFDRNRHSVEARAVGRPVQAQAYATKIVILQDGRIVGAHARAFGRDGAICDPWRYAPVPARKPGALGDGAPFKEMTPPPAMAKLRERLSQAPDGCRRMGALLPSAHETASMRGRRRA